MRGPGLRRVLPDRPKWPSCHVCHQRPRRSAPYACSPRFVFRSPRKKFSLSYHIPCINCFLDATTDFNGGRNFLFGGASALCAWPTEPPTDFWDACSGSNYEILLEGATLTANNLGGAGPNFDDEPVLRYADVTTKDGESVDLVVSVVDGTEYLVADNYDKYQGQWELFGQINVRDDSTASLRFSFVDSADEPVVLNKFYITVFDIDQQRKDNRHKERLCIDSFQIDSYVLPDSTSLEVEDQSVACDGSPGSSTIFRSTEAGFECDNPTDPLDLGKRPASVLASSALFPSPARPVQVPSSATNATNAWTRASTSTSPSTNRRAL